jgi:hypothetical protein
LRLKSHFEQISVKPSGEGKFAQSIDCKLNINFTSVSHLPRSSCYSGCNSDKNHVETCVVAVFILKMQPISQGMQNLVGARLRKVQNGQGPLLAWPLACGSQVAKRTTALNFSDGILRVQVPDAGWRKELQAIAAQYLAILNRYVAEKVQRIEFVL